MIVAVSMREVDTQAYDEIRDAISQDWVRYLDRLGVTPVLVPNVLTDPAGFIREVGAKGLLLTGGDDLGPLASEGGGEKLNPRDATERALLSSAVEEALPVMGICRGLQLINVHFGGDLNRDLSGLGKHGNSVHEVRLIGNFASQFGGEREVRTNSYHQQGVMLDGLGKELEPFALANGGIVEGLTHPRLPILAVQWHPERPHSPSKLDSVLFADWLEKCA